MAQTLVPENRLWLDPRTKVLMLILINTIIFNAGQYQFSYIIRPLLMMIPFVLLLIEKRYRFAFIYLTLIIIVWFIQTFILLQTTGTINLILMIFTNAISHFMPALVSGYYVFTTTKITEFVAAMERMHFPQAIIIPFAVMLRFIPSVNKDRIAIKDAMKMRGIYFGGKKASSIIEYRVVPLLMSSIKTGEDLSAAALTRGLGHPTKRTIYSRCGLGYIDWMIIVIMLLIVLVWVLF